MDLTDGYFSARLKLLIGQRGVSDLMASLDLGITAVGYEKLMELDYKPGEIVDEARVRKAMDKTIARMDKEHTPDEIVSYEIIEIVFVPDSQEGKI